MVAPSGGIDELPPELKELVAQNLESTRDLQNLRQVNRSWKIPAERKLFRRISLRADDVSVKYFHWLADSEKLSYFVRHITIETLPNLDMTGRVEDLVGSEYHEQSAKLQQAIPLLGTHFPGLNSVNIKFSADNSGHDSDHHAWGGTVLQSHRIRHDLLLELYKALVQRHEPSSISQRHAELRPVTSFTGTNLLRFTNKHMEDVPSTEKFFAGITELNFSVRVKRTRTVHFDALLSSQTKLRESWLEPAAAAKLTSLSIYMDTYWGAVPYFELKGLKLPHLRRLSLGNYCFAYPTQIAWLTSLTSLEFLSLDDCPIVFLVDPESHLRENDLLDPRSGWTLRSYDSDSTRFYVNNTRWHQYFSRIGEGLTNLTEFRCGHGQWRATGNDVDYFRQAFEEREALGSVVHSTRYVVFVGRPSSYMYGAWLEVDQDFPDGNELSEDAKDRLERKISDESQRPVLDKENRIKDEQALAKLLQQLGRRHAQRR